MKSIKNCISLLLMLFVMLICNKNVVKAADASQVTGSLNIVNQYVLSKKDISKDDLLWVKGLPAINSNWRIEENSKNIIMDENLSSSGAIIESSIDKTVLKDNEFVLKVDSNNPIIVVKSTLGDTIKSFKLSDQELNSGKVNYFIKNNLNQKIKEMNSEWDNQVENNLSPFINFVYYPGQKNGHKYKAGVHVQCNDFNGPANTSHYYWSRRSGVTSAAKALKNFVGSDCDYHQFIYGCEMSGNTKCRGLNKHPHNCSSFSSKHPHTNWSVRLHWRS